MGKFNSLLLVAKLESAGVPRYQAEVHAQALQDIYDQEHQQYATKADFLVFNQQIKSQLEQLDIKTDRLDEKITQIEMKVTSEIKDLKHTVDEIKTEFSGFRSEMTMLRTSHKYMLWVCGGVATMCMSMIAMFIPVFLHSIK